jgi:PAS domain S-box-containing protein
MSNKTIETGANSNQTTHGLSMWFIRLCGGFSALLGAVVLLGWYTKNVTLIQVLPSFVPMQYNTALGFLICGMGLLIITLKPGFWAKILGGLPVLIGGLTLFQYIFNAGLGIDQLLMEHYITVATSHPGRMAPNTALCFVLTGLAILVMGHKKSFRLRPLTGGLLGSVILALGAVAFFGYLSGIETAYGWGNLTRMAVHTALGFVALGIGIFICGWREEVSREKSVPRWLAIPAGIAITAIAIFQWQALIAEEQGSYEMIYPIKKSPLPIVILGAGLLMALLLTIMIQQAQKLWARAKIVEKTNRELQEEIKVRKQIEEAMRKSEVKYRLLADHTIDCIWRMDLDYTFTYINPSVLPTFGYTPGEWTGTSLAGHCTPEAFAFIKEEIRNELKHTSHRTGMTFETEFLHKDGHKIPLEVNGKILLNLDGQPVEIQGTMRDIAIRKVAEEEKEKLEELLRQSQKMEALGTLAGGIAHDFNNILGVLMGYAELSLEEMKEETSITQNLRQIMVSSQRAKDMVKQILAFSRKSEVEHMPIHVSQVVQEALKLLRSSIPTTIDIRSNIGTKPATVMADPTQLHQVIMNLCTNAAHAMRENGGILEVSLQTVHAKPDSPDLKELAAGKYEKLTIKDSGHGMNEETRKRIFEPYFTTKQPGEGTGMGLAVVHGIIKNHGGEITVHSEPGKGSTFHVYLPLAQSDTAPIKKSSGEQKIIGGSESILLVDDEQSLLEMQKTLIQRLGYRVTIRTGSVEALEAFKAAPHKYHLVITDQTMPNMTGIQLAREIKKIRPDIPVILCTGFSENVNEDNFKSMGIDAFVLKPIIKKKIAPLIREALDSPPN